MRFETNCGHFEGDPAYNRQPFNQYDNQSSDDDPQLLQGRYTMKHYLSIYYQ